MTINTFGSMHTLSQDIRRSAARLRILEHDAEGAHKYTKEEVDAVVLITCGISPWMNMGLALEVLDAGMANIYINNQEYRSSIDLWAKTRYAGLSLKEFMSKIDGDTT